MANEKWMRSQVCRWLVENGLTPIFEVYLCHTCDFVGVEFAEQTGRLIPAIKRSIAVELKLDDVAGVIKQSVLNQHRVATVYAAMPKGRVTKMRPETIDKFRLQGIGLLSVTAFGVEVVVEPIASPKFKPTAFMANTFHRRLWRRRKEWIKRLAAWEERNLQPR